MEYDRVNLTTDQVECKGMFVINATDTNIFSVSFPTVMFLWVNSTCQVICWLCLSANSHHLNAPGSSGACRRRPDPLRSWCHHRGGQLGWQETPTADRSEPPAGRWVRSPEEPSPCSAKVVTMHSGWTHGCRGITSTCISIRWATAGFGMSHESVFSSLWNRCCMTCFTKLLRQHEKQSKSSFFCEEIIRWLMPYFIHLWSATD